MHLSSTINEWGQRFVKHDEQFFDQWAPCERSDYPDSREVKKMDAFLKMPYLHVDNHHHVATISVGEYILGVQQLTG